MQQRPNKLLNLDLSVRHYNLNDAKRLERNNIGVTNKRYPQFWKNPMILSAKQLFELANYNKFLHDGAYHVQGSLEILGDKTVINNGKQTRVIAGSYRINGISDCTYFQIHVIKHNNGYFVLTASSAHLSKKELEKSLGRRYDYLELLHVSLVNSHALDKFFDRFSNSFKTDLTAN